MEALLAFLCLQCLLLHSVADDPGPSGTKCPQASDRKETCVCKPADEGIIDLIPLSNTDGTPRYIHVL